MTIKRLLISAIAAVGVSLTAHAQPTELSIMAPAAPGGGWDQTARSMQSALQEAGLVANVQVTNVPGRRAAPSASPSSSTQQRRPATI